MKVEQSQSELGSVFDVLVRHWDTWFVSMGIPNFPLATSPHPPYTATSCDSGSA
jgi:hypothetical protein